MSLDSDRYQGLAGFRYALRRFLAASETISHAAGITQQQYQTMLAIRTREHEAMPIKALAEQLLITHHAAVQLVDRLESGGLGRRGPAPPDRRRVLVAVTEKGSSLLDTLAEQHLEEILRQEPLL